MKQNQEKCVEMQVSGSHPRSTKSDSVGVGDKLSRRVSGSKKKKKEESLVSWNVIQGPYSDVLLNRAVTCRPAASYSKATGKTCRSSHIGRERTWACGQDTRCSSSVSFWGRRPHTLWPHCACTLALCILISIRGPSSLVESYGKLAMLMAGERELN